MCVSVYSQIMCVGVLLVITSVCTCIISVFSYMCMFVGFVHDFVAYKLRILLCVCVCVCV